MPVIFIRLYKLADLFIFSFGFLRSCNEHQLLRNVWNDEPIHLDTNELSIKASNYPFSLFIKESYFITNAELMCRHYLERITNSVRLFFARPSGVSLLATGLF